MRRLKFDVSGQRLTKTGDFSNIVIGSKKYLYGEFTFNEEWNGMAKVATFNDVPVSIGLDGLAMLPDSVTDAECIKVKVIGKNIHDVVIQTNTELFIQVS